MFLKRRFFIYTFIFYLLVSHSIYAQEIKDSEIFPKEQIKRAVSLINEGAYKEAEDILHKFEDNNLWQDKVNFLLGRLYKEEGSFKKAKYYLKKAIDSFPLLRDYALKLLTEIYILEEKYVEAIKTVRQIQNKSLIHDVKKAEVNSLLSLKDEEAAVDVLSQYVTEYPLEWESKLLLARLLSKNGKRERAIGLFKEIYINDNPFSKDALNELVVMGADRFTTEELLERADNLYKNADFESAESTYKMVLKDISDKKKKDRVVFLIGMCQFNQKRYDIAAKTFGDIENPEAMYWKARSLYRLNDIEGFKGIIKRFERKYPKSEYLAKLLLTLADEERRSGRLNEAERLFKKVLDDFPNKEKALWGLGWMHYTSGNYREAKRLFSALSALVEDNGQYIYWEAKTQEMLDRNCNPSNNDNCSSADSVYRRLLNNQDYYGFLARARHKIPDVYKIPEMKKPKIPKDEVFRRIEALKFLGMTQEAINEIRLVLESNPDPEELRYLGDTAFQLGEYHSILYLVENLEDEGLIHLAYPLAFWDTIKEAADKEGVDPYLIVALIREESRFDQDALSKAGAIGLMQLMPFTAFRVKKELNIELKDESDIYNIRNNILIGTHYLSNLLKEFGRISFAIAAYNAGEDVLKKWLIESKHKDIDEFIEDIPYTETRNYVKRVFRSYWQYRAINGLPILGFTFNLCF
jgi:soluble lytic murein transglycosylase